MRLIELKFANAFEWQWSRQTPGYNVAEFHTNNQLLKLDNNQLAVKKSNEDQARLITLVNDKLVLGKPQTIDSSKVIKAIPVSYKVVIESWGQTPIESFRKYNLEFYVNLPVTDAIREWARSHDYYGTSSHSIMGLGDQFRVFATVIDILQNFVIEHKTSEPRVAWIYFSADEPSRQDLYVKFIQWFSAGRLRTQSFGFSAFSITGHDFYLVNDDWAKAIIQKQPRVELMGDSYYFPFTFSLDYYQKLGFKLDEKNQRWVLANEMIQELKFQSIKPYRWIDNSESKGAGRDNVSASFSTGKTFPIRDWDDDGNRITRDVPISYEVRFVPDYLSDDFPNWESWDLEFVIASEIASALEVPTFGITKTGDEITVFSTVIKIIEDFVSNKHRGARVADVHFFAFEKNRQRLYNRLIQWFNVGSSELRKNFLGVSSGGNYNIVSKDWIRYVFAEPSDNLDFQRKKHLQYYKNNYESKIDPHTLAQVLKSA